MKTIHELSALLEKKRTEKQILEKSIKEWGDERKEKQTLFVDLQTAREIFQKAAKATQQQLSFQTSDIVTKALAAVFDDPYKFKMDFVERRNVTECDLWFEKGGELFDPLSDCGYGTADIASLALRAAFWKLEGNARNFLALDEPTRNLSADRQPLASLMIKKLSEIGIQFLIVTHNKDLTTSADKVFLVQKEKQYSIVEEIQ